MLTLNDLPHVAIYIRVSTLEQAHNGFSIEGQLKDIRSYCDKKGYKVVRLYNDKGYSGASIERPKLQLMLQHANEKLFDRIIIWKYDRLSRNSMEFPALLYFFNKYDIQIESINEPTPNDGSPYNEFIINIIGLVSDLERKLFIMRSKMGRKVRASKGLWKGGTPPYGYEYNKQTGMLEIDEVEKNGAKMIFKKFIECRNYHEVARFLNKNSIKPRRSKKWSDNTIKVILIKKIYIGKYSEGDFEKDIPEYRIIDDNTFNLAQKMIGTGGTPAYGYKWDLKTGNLVVNEEEIKHVKKFFQLFYDWCSLAQIKEYINENDVYTKHFGRYWQEQTIFRILCNPIYCGYRSLPGPNNKCIYDENLKIVEDWVFQDIQTIGKLKYKTFKRCSKDLDEIRDSIINHH